MTGSGTGKAGDRHHRKQTPRRPRTCSSNYYQRLNICEWATNAVVFQDTAEFPCKGGSGWLFKTN